MGTIYKAHLAVAPAAEELRLAVAAEVGGAEAVSGLLRLDAPRALHAAVYAHGAVGECVGEAAAAERAQRRYGVYFRDLLLQRLLRAAALLTHTIHTCRATLLRYACSATR